MKCALRTTEFPMANQMTWPKRGVGGRVAGQFACARGVLVVGLPPSIPTPSSQPSQAARKWRHSKPHIALIYGIISTSATTTRAGAGCCRPVSCWPGFGVGCFGVWSYKLSLGWRWLLVLVAFSCCCYRCCYLQIIEKFVCPDLL